MYGKIINNEFYGAPNKLNENGMVIWNPPTEIYLKQGWKFVEFNDPVNEPPIGYYYEMIWKENENTIVQEWVLTPLPDNIDEVEAYDIIFGDIE